MMKWFKGLSNSVATVIVISAFILLVLFAFLSESIGWFAFAFFAPLILPFIGGRWIAPEFGEQEETANRYLKTIPFATVIIGFFDKIFSLNCMAMLFRLLLEHTATISCIMLFVALSAPLCRLVERQTQRRNDGTGGLTKVDFKYWFKDTFATNFTGWLVFR
ncbi:MAG: hypothetical protein LBR98_01865 [Syntrophomonadaceae bacterium]|nr:hypothetical protein [Syntrophomonadaceae bacterium]